MTVRYTGSGGIRPVYECLGRWEHGNKATCSSVPAMVIDHAVSEKILSVMKVPELEIALRIIHNISSANQLSDRQWLLSLERAQYEADRAERQFMLADPENRLVVRSLESNWNQKLKDLEKLKQDYALHCARKPWSPSAKEEEDIRRLAERIPEIWNSPLTTPKEKKRIIRILIEDVTVFAEKRCRDFSIGIRFRSGKCEKLALEKPLPAPDRKRHTDDTVNLIRELSSSLDDHEIAGHLNLSGIATPEGKAFTTASVRWLRYKHHIPGLFQTEKQGISVSEAAALLGISSYQVYSGISSGKIPARKERPGWPWEILIDPSNLETVKALFNLDYSS